MEPSPQTPTKAETDLLIAFTRLEGKVDVALAQHGADIAVHGKEIQDHEARIRALESTPTVSPRTLWTTVASAAGLAIAAFPLIQQIVSR
ncbi:membrane protein [Arthrobacter phage Iter]|uniref:Minor tail protein n=1 Tax=Arthrobacter phage Ascela TaxID=3038360 RepID=A0AAF0GIE7_9CAUD|nr:membrane protein [Arthrobacter phage Iter]WGH21545.1 minor tail protein [Arthrobacter phage Ascela]